MHVKSNTNPIKSIYLEQLGCPKNSSEGDRILGGLLETGSYHIAPNADAADIILINTCSFIKKSQVESIDTILHYETWAKEKEKEVWVTGCLIESHGKEIQTSFSSHIQWIPFSHFTYNWLTRHHSMFPGSAYIKIAEGCHRTCRFCTIPLFKGNYVSRDPKDIVQEAQYLAAHKGVKEIILVAQDTTAFGYDRIGWSLLSLIEQLHSLENIEWIRIMYLYPSEITPHLVSALANLPKFCPYYDIPMQHFSESVLRNMGRVGGRKAIDDCVSAIRTYHPSATIRTTCIVGYPGETDADIQILLDALDTYRINWLGAFTFSDEPTAASYKIQPKVPNSLKKERYKTVMNHQKAITQQWLSSRIEQTIPVLLEEVISNDAVSSNAGRSRTITAPQSGNSQNEEMAYTLGRSRHEAPEVDGTIILPDYIGEPGTIVTVTVTHALEYDLLGRVLP